MHAFREFSLTCTESSFLLEMSEEAAAKRRRLKKAKQAARWDEALETEGWNEEKIEKGKKENEEVDQKVLRPGTVARHDLELLILEQFLERQRPGFSEEVLKRGGLELDRGESRSDRYRSPAESHLRNMEDLCPKPGLCHQGEGEQVEEEKGRSVEVGSQIFGGSWQCRQSRFPFATS